MRRLTKQQREAVRLRYGGRCAYCGCELGARWHADHVEPVMREMRFAAAGDGVSRRLVATGAVNWPERDTLANLLPSCPPCNLYKGGLLLEEWRRAIQHLPALLERDSGPFRHAVRFGLAQALPQPVVFFFERQAAQEAQR